MKFIIIISICTLGLVQSLYYKWHVHFKENSVNVSILKPWTNYTMNIQIVDNDVKLKFNAKNVPCTQCGIEFINVGGLPLVSIESSVVYGPINYGIKTDGFNYQWTLNLTTADAGLVKYTIETNHGF